MSNKPRPSQSPCSSPTTKTNTCPLHTLVPFPSHITLLPSSFPMDRWRNFFSNANVDIWTIIEKSILVAAVYHPDDFKIKRSDIAETLFARHLVQNLQPERTLTGSVKGLHKNEPEKAQFLEESDLKGDKEEGFRRISPSGDGLDHVFANGDDETQDQEGLLIQQLEKIKELISDNSQPESALLAALQSLENIKITVSALKVTETGRQVSNLRKHPCKDIRLIAKRLVRQWKLLLDDWVKNGEGAPAIASAATSSDCRGVPEGANRSRGLSTSSPSTTITSLHDASQLFRSVDGGTCEQTQSVEKLSIKGGSMYDTSKSLSRSLQNDSTYCDQKLNVSHVYSLDTLGEMGSATRDNVEKISNPLSRESSNQYDAALNRFPSSRGPVKPSVSASYLDESKATLIYGSAVRSSSDQGLSNANQRHGIEKNLASKSNGGCIYPLANKRVEKSQADQKLEISKRKLQEGYQQAEIAKKQRTVQVLDFQDMPRSEACGKTNHPPLLNKGGKYRIQNRRCG